MQREILDYAEVTSLHPQAAGYQVAVLGALRAREIGLRAGLGQFVERGQALARIAEALVAALHAGKKVLVAGNGGSAAEAQHFAGELVGRFLLDRRPYAALALTVDTSILTAVGNDFGFDDVFARQVLALGQPGDLLVLFSTSGESANLIRAADAAHRQGLTVAAITGDRANSLERVADLPLRVPATETPRIQELQMMVTHILCEIAEAEMVRMEMEDAR